MVVPHVSPGAHALKAAEGFWWVLRSGPRHTRSLHLSGSGFCLQQRQKFHFHTGLQGNLIYGAVKSF